MSGAWRRGLRGALRVAVAVAAASCGTRDDGAGTPQLATARDDAGNAAALACAPGELATPGLGCVAAGVPPSMCGDGFTSDGASGCMPVLPATPCADGTMAIPGETTCREVSPCADGTWGDAPVDAATAYVDAAFTGASDGSRDRPWRRIQDGVDAAPDGALVAIAAGTYVEQVYVKDKSLRLWGRCPRLVAITQPAPPGIHDSTAALTVVHAKVVVHGLALASADIGLRAGDAADATLERVWAHDLAIGMIAGPQTYHLGTRTSSLASAVRIEDSLGDQVGSCVAALRVGAVTVERSAFRRFFPSGVDAIVVAPAGGPVAVRIDASTFEDVLGSAIDFAAGSAVAADIDGVSVRAASGGSGPCVTFGGEAIARIQHARLDGCTTGVATGNEAGVTDISLAATTLRTTYSRHGGAEAALSLSGGRLRASAVAIHLVRRSAAVSAAGVDVELDGVLVLATDADAEPTAEFASTAGIVTTLDPVTAAPSRLTVRGSEIDGVVGAGILVETGEATIDATVIRGVIPLDGQFGDAVSIIGWHAGAPSTIHNCELQGSARAAISNFGASVTVDATRFDDDAIDLDGETYQSTPPTFDDLGGNTCVSGGAVRPCQVQSASLAPPLSAQ